jgi:hypothetical protein
LVSRHFLPVALGLVAAFVLGCSRTTNLVLDSDMSHAGEGWNIQGRFEVRPGLGPEGDTLLYYPGDGSASGYRNSASFLCGVEPGKTYTFSIYIDATGHEGTPPYAILDAANGTWKGVSLYQADKGRVSTTFEIPADSGTTALRVTLNPENGIYPVGRGAEYSEPQLELGSVADAYVTGATPAMTNLIFDSSARDPMDYWQVTGRMRLARDAGPRGSSAFVYDGDGRHSGFGNTAAFFAPVEPGTTYTFSVYLDGTGHEAAPPYAFLQAADGTWKGVQVYQSARGRVSVTFTIPSDAGTTLVRGWMSPQNGTYPRGRRFVAAQPQLEAGAFADTYQVDNASGIPAPTGGNRVIDSDMLSAVTTWKFSGRMAVDRTGSGGAGTVSYLGDGRPSGYGNEATFYARVTPGHTYSFSAEMDGASHVGAPPYVFLRAVNGSWSGAQADQPGWGRVIVRFLIPPDSRTTCIAGTVTPQGGTYPAGTRMTFAEPQIAEGPFFMRYVRSPATESAWARWRGGPCGP